MISKRYLTIAVLTCVALLAVGIAHAAGIAPAHLSTLDMAPLAPMLIGTIADSTANDNDQPLAPWATLRKQYNLLVAEATYFRLNRIISATAATYPVIAAGSGGTKPKTTNATVCLCAGAVNEVAAADNAFTLTGSVLAASKYRRYLLLVDAADAKTVLASDDADTLAECRFPSLPANGKCILGVCNIGTDASHTFTPDTTGLADAGITTTYQDGVDIYVSLPTLVTP